MAEKEVAKLVETWRKRADAINDPMLAHSSGLRQLADELESALATAPPAIPEAKPISAWIEQQQQTTPRGKPEAEK